jgi:hypothetical protein
MVLSQRYPYAEHPYTITSINNLAICLNEQGQYGEAQNLSR